ncbi:MAG: DUF4920 domain-containing protein [Winogradskyella sp.]|uniref:DUF4920 domain-containing protein n=1 Tax=Winogradskyella sp. TaxID=1883156 RepID=UPI00182F6C62|nr:DUF4920 domain-containing protein [Winogradskyella sp.]MBT8245349.1 DUF4920 domain-containing protein [Winogradskyella sp.]NNK23648.1 DUF4920 domain-containing protein [Winogradskyella sp.]
MKRFLNLLIITVLIVSCNNETKTSETEQQIETKDIAYNSFGDKITDSDALTSERMMVHYESMKVGDTVNAKMRGTISEVCSKKGCWMKLDMGDDKIVRVTFKDYGFFMPLNATGEVVVNGKAFVSETSVDDLKHYAEDAGQSAKEIAKITEPERTFSFLADGVLLKQ